MQGWNKSDGSWPLHWPSGRVLSVLGRLWLTHVKTRLRHRGAGPADLKKMGPGVLEEDRIAPRFSWPFEDQGEQSSV